MATWIVGLILVVIVLVFGFLMMAHSASPPDPFRAYTDLLKKDQAMSAIQRLNFSCIDKIATVSQYCSLTPTDATFKKVSLTTQWSTLTSITFEARENALRVGDLAAAWGEPMNLYDLSQSDLLVWTKREDINASAIIVRTARLSYFTHVWTVTFVY